MFSALRQGATLYLLDKSEEPTVKVGYVENVTSPRSMYNTYNPAVSFGANMQTVVDICVKIGDQKKDIIGVPSNATVHAYGDYVITETRDAMISEVSAMLQSSKSVLESMDRHEKMVLACEEILKELNPVYARESERDSAIEALTDRMNNMQTVLNRLESFITRKESHENN